MTVRRIAALLAIGLLIAACSAGPGTGGQLEGTDWVLRAYAEEGSLVTVPETLFADAEFRTNRVSGFSGCNDFDTLYRAGGRTLFISESTASTLMACSDEANALESAYRAALHASRFYSERRGTLTIFDAQGTTVLVFDAAPRNPLLGNWIVDSFATAPGSVTATIEGTSLTAVFGIASVGGSAGCNQYTGTYGTNGNVVRVGRLATTRIACADEIMTQETAFLEAMQGAALIDQRGQTLMLTDLSGSTLVALVRPSAIPATSPAPSAGASETPEATPTEEPSEEPTEEPTAEPTATARPTATPTAAPTLPPRPTPAPTVEPPPSIPPTATCDLVGPDGQALAAIAYPAAWFTLEEPAELACRYFDPEAITVPADPATLQTAVTVLPSATPFADAINAATDPASWDATRQTDVTVGTLPATLVEAVAIADSAGVPIGTASFAYIVDYGAAGTLTIRTTGTSGAPDYVANAAVATLMAAKSTFTPPG
jgi:heat shock protein HslJ